jgi:hypothetical protein
MSTAITIPIPPERDLGPCMRALTDLQRAFVVATFTQGKRDATQAARSAGYQGDRNVLGVTAHRLTHNPKIVAAMKEEGERRMDMLGSIAIEKLGDILENSVDHKTTLKAIDMTLGRVGFHQRSESLVTTRTEHSSLEKIEKLVRLAKAMGLNPETLVGRFAPKEETDGNVSVGNSDSVVDDPDVIDAEFEEVDPAAQAAIDELGDIL